MHIPTILSLISLLPLTLSHPSAPSHHLRARQTDDPNVYTPKTFNGSGIDPESGWYHHWWNQGETPATFTNGPGGNYVMQWNSYAGSFIGGKGWEKGSARNVSYTARSVISGMSFLSVYGYMRFPTGALYEYYMMEGYSNYSPLIGASPIGNINSPFRRLGSFTARSGNTYDLAVERHSRPSMLGTLNGTYYSVKSNHPYLLWGTRNGTVDTGEHFEAWREVGLELGELDVMLLAVEGYYSGGNATVEVFDGLLP